MSNLPVSQPAPGMVHGVALKHFLEACVSRLPDDSGIVNESVDEPESDPDYDSVSDEEADARADREARW